MSGIEKEKSFISAVVYLYNDGEKTKPFFQKLQNVLCEHFENYEFVDNTVSILKEFASEINIPFTIIHMSLHHGREHAMNAGIDAAIGDYIFEFDSTQTPYDMSLAFDAYRCSQKGSDIVCVCPSKTNISSKLFYNLYNASSDSAYKLQTDAFRLVTRRAVNRVHASNSFMPYRKAAYAASGLKMSAIVFDGSIKNYQKSKLSLAFDSLALYTKAGFNLSMGITIFMMLVAIAEIVYTISIYCMGKPIEGWTTTMLVITFGFLGLFLVFSIAIKYLSLNLDMLFRKQKYYIESIEKV